MTDERLLARLRGRGIKDTIAAADRIEALTEQLKAARADAKEAEAYAEELERDLKTCRMAQAVMENTVAELELKSEFFEEEWVSAVDKLNKAVKALQYYAVEAMPWEADDSLISRATLAEIEGEKE
jgi:chromosome segregation ATPase